MPLAHGRKVLHLLALAHEADVALTIDDFSAIGARVPLLANLSPHGRYHMSEPTRKGPCESF